ncbi:MAG: DUF1963 domain-containing protein, partial [Verrucomicrobiota bacterium]
VTLHGHETWILHGKTEASLGKDTFRIRYVFATLFLDDRYFLHLEAMHESEDPWEFEAWVQPALDSLHITGDSLLRDQAWETHLAEVAEAEAAIEAARIHSSADELEKAYQIPLEVPTDGRDVFELGGLPGSYLDEDSSLEIGKLSRQLEVRLSAEVSDWQQGPEFELFREGDEGRVALWFSAAGIYGDAALNGEYRLKEGRSGTPHSLTLFSSGLGPWDFSGRLRLQEDWILLSGQFLHKWERAGPVSIQIARRVSLARLDWRDYRFRHLEEIRQVKPEVVRSVQIENPEFTFFPVELLALSELRELTLQAPSAVVGGGQNPLRGLPDDFGSRYPHVESLRISGFAMETLPESIGQLKKLTSLFICHCRIKQLPSGLLSLPNLVHAWFSKNQLESLTDPIDLPALQVLDLSGNRLDTLPESLAAQPSLQRLVLRGNPWESLPDAFNEVVAIELSIEDKQRLLDFEYRGADGEGMVDWDDAAYWAANDPDLSAEMDQVIENEKLSEYRDVLRSLVTKGVAFRQGSEEDYEAVGTHRFGGMPDLPMAVPYPEFGEHKYEFIAQINCGELASFQSYLPRTGVLFFFLETIHSLYGGSEQPGKVIYVPDVDQLASGTRFSFEEDDYLEMIGGAYEAYQVTPTKMGHAPSMYAKYVNAHLLRGAAKPLQDDEDFWENEYERFSQALNEAVPMDHAINIHGFTQHESPELQASLALKGNPEDWMTLLLVGSSGGMQWGDAGDLFYVIHKSDLEKKDFSKVFVTMESS